MKTIIARFEDMKKDPMAILEDGVSANKVEAALATIGIALRDSAGEFRALQDVMDELGMKWNDLSRNQQAYIATVAAGSRQQSRFLALMNNYDRTLDLITESQNSAGAAAQQYAIYQDSIAAAQARLTASWENFYSKIVDNGLIKTAINGMATLVDTLSHIPPIITVIGAAIGALELQNIFRIMHRSESSVSKLAGGFKDLYEAAKGNVGSFSELKQITPRITDIFKGLGTATQGIGTTIIGAGKAVASFISVNAWWFVAGIAIAGIIAGITYALNAQKRAYEENIDEIKKYQEESNNLQTKTTNAENLIESYEELATKINRTAEEQNELNNIIEQIAQIYPEAKKWVDEYGNSHLENVKTLKEEIEYEKELAKDRTRIALQQRGNLLNNTDRSQWKKEDFNTIGFSSKEIDRYFNLQAESNLLNRINPAGYQFRLNRTQAYIDNIKLPEIDRKQGAISDLNKIIESLNLVSLGFNKLNDHSEWKDIEKLQQQSQD